MIMLQTLPQIKEARFNLKHLNNRFSRGGFSGIKSHNQTMMRRKQRLLMTRLRGAWFLKSRRLRGGAPSHVLYLHLRCSNTHRLGNKYHSSLSIVTIVKHVTPPLWCAATVCLPHGAEGKTDHFLH